MKTLKFIFLLILLFSASCSKGNYRFKDYVDAQTTFKHKRIEHPSKLFSIAIPINWEWTIEFEGDNTSFTGIDVVSPKYSGEFINLISIRLMPSMSEKQSLQSEYTYLLKQYKKGSSMLMLIDSGKSNFLGKPAYFSHLKSKIALKNTSELISFVLQSGEHGKFYHLTASVSNSNDKLEQMGLLLSILKTIKFNDLTKHSDS